MPLVLIDGKEVELADGERLNGIQAAHRAGVEIPHYCWHPGLSVVASCRMCLVETGTRNAETGAITMVPKLVPACQTPATPNTVFVTTSDKVRQARAMVEEDLLIDHPVDCPICDKAGECHLQDYHFEHGQTERRADILPFTSRRREMGPTVTLFVDRCVMCSRCVRFCREVAGTSELLVIHRGSHEEIDVFPGYPLVNKLAGNVVDLCPVGALGDKDFLYRQRVWFMKRHESVCTGCATGCSIWIDENQDTVYRLKPRDNPFVNQYWMCDEGRYGYHHIHSPERVTSVRRRDRGDYAPVDWSTLPAELTARLRAAGRLTAVVSPFLTVEEAWLLSTYMRSLDPEAQVVLGPTPTEGEDERFPSGFTIRAEKAPNRRGVEAVIWHFMGRLPTWEDLLQDLATDPPGAVWVSGGYRAAWHTAEEARAFAGVGLLVVQDLFASPLWDRATYQIPGATFAERDGSYVNAGDRLQSVRWAVRPPAGVWPEGPLLARLVGKAGLYNARAALAALAAEVSYFSAALGEIPSTGIDLRINQLAAAETEAAAS
jgi:NADH-quinone oxidoreductase subunit G